VVSNPRVCLRTKEHMDSLAMACFNQIFLMVFLSIWLRRSNVTTGAEWIQTRFGTGKGSLLSHNIVVVYASY